MSSLELLLEEIMDSSLVRISDMKPSDWAEENIIMPKPFPGPLRYETTPYTREIIDCFAPDHPAREIAVMGAAQFGKTASVIVPVIGYIIANDPGNIIMTVGHDDLLKEAMEKIDAMLDSTGLRKLIRPTAQRAKANKTGDTDAMKQFPLGYLKLATASNPKIWRQSDYRYGLIDDYDAVKRNTKIAGSTNELIGKRFTAYSKTKKILYVSSPELEISSNIFEAYNLGDKRKFLVPCPCCGVFIELVWSIKGKVTEHAGITWNTDEQNKLIPDSVGYTCQECGDFFTDQYKSAYVNKGYWQPTAVPFKPDFYSYHMSCLYSPHGMDDWEHYVYKYIECHPRDGERDEKKYQTFLNLNLGLPYKEPGETPKANQLQKNICNYEIGTIPEKLSEQHGNGKIILLTLSADLNGVVEDARIDWEVVAWSESGTSYSIDHGSIGTFIPREGSKKNKVDRLHWTYEHGKGNSVWPELTKILDTKYNVDTGRRMSVAIAGVDTGHYDEFAWPFINNSNYNIVGLKGKDGDKYIRFSADNKLIKPANALPNLYLVTVGLVKDQIAKFMRLKYDSGNDDSQPPNYMNYPMPSGLKYNYETYFRHYESEQRVSENKDGDIIASRWEKITTIAQNHFWDCRVYNVALKEVWLFQLAKEFKVKAIEWHDYATMVIGK